MSPKHLIALVALAMLNSPVSAQSVKAGIDAWQKGDYANAVAIWRPMAEAGDPDAQFNLGQAYRLGRGVKISLSQSQIWFEKAGSQGHVDAQTTLGLLLFQNGDQAGGVKWLKLAAEQDEPRALLVYGTALVNGDSVTQNPVLGYAYVRRAAAQGLEPARETLTQLEKLMLADVRKKGTALAASLARNAGSAAVGRPKAVASKPARKTPKPPAAAQQPAPAQVASAARPKAPPAAAPAKAAPVKTAPATGAVTGNWRIQVGAFNNRATAEAAYAKLSGNAALAGRSPQYIPFGQFIRLRIGPFASKGAAASACSAVRVACFPVAPGK